MTGLQRTRTPFKAALGTKIRTLRVGMGLTQRELGDAIGLTRSSVANIEGGYQSIPVEGLTKVAAALGTNTGILLDGVSLALPTYLVVVSHTLRCNSCGWRAETTEPDQLDGLCSAHTREHIIADLGYAAAGQSTS